MYYINVRFVISNDGFNCWCKELYALCKKVKLNKEIKSGSIKKSRTNKPKFDEFIMKVNIEHFGYNYLLQHFKFMKSIIKIAMGVWWNC